MRVLAYCLMPNHWHLVVWPARDGELSRYMHWLTMTHTQRWHAHHHTVGTGPLYQGRFKAFPIQENYHYWTVCRYVERNALRAGLVPRAEKWPWSSLWLRERGQVPPWLYAGPVALPADWQEYVNGIETEAELAALRRCLVRGLPWGDARWQKETVQRLGLEATLRNRGRPRKLPKAPDPFFPRFLPGLSTIGKHFGANSRTLFMEDLLLLGCEERHRIAVRELGVPAMPDAIQSLIPVFRPAHGS